MKRILIHFALVSFFFAFAAAQNAQQHHALMPLNCKECHSCEKPSHENPCLKLFPEFRRQSIQFHNTLENTTDVFIIDTLANEYEPSVFTHRLHAEMMEKSGGCTYCHHHNPSGGILACSACHSPNMNKEQPQNRTLKGAYHQQCMQCHLAWNTETQKRTDCTSCHALKGQSQHDKIHRYNGTTHDQFPGPHKKIYQTGMEDGPVVTFYHEDHSKLFGISCANCHQGNSCSPCHILKPRGSVTTAETHQNCIGCHEKEINDNCTKCHDVKEKASFSHSRAGWALVPHHDKLECKACHKTVPVFTKMSRSCNSCHAAWSPENFKHRVTGLELDENHRENDCTACHPDRRFADKPVCTDCHEDYVYPDKKPGKSVK